MVGTIKPYAGFNAAVIAEQIRTATEGFGTDENALIQILSRCNNAQRLEAANAYKTSYGKDLIADIKSELHGDFEEVMVAVLQAPRMFDVHQLNQAMAGAGTDEVTILEILTSRSNKEIQEIKAIYKNEYGKELEAAICGDVSGYFERLCISLLAANREPEGAISHAKAQEDAQKFFDAGEKRWGTEEAELNRILCLRSFTQLRATMAHFEHLAGHSMEDSILKECSGTLQQAYRAIVQLARSPPEFFARRLNECMAGMGTSDNDLIRIIVSRSEVDLEEIKTDYQRRYGKPLRDAVASECGGDYKKMLLCLIDQPK